MSSKIIPFACESFPNIASKANYSRVDLSHVNDDHEGFFFFIEPDQQKQNGVFPVIQQMRIQNFGTAFLTVYGYTDEKEIDALLPYYALNTTKTRLQEDKRNEMSLSIFGSATHSFITFAERVRKTWTVLLPDTQLLLESHYVKRDPKFWQKQFVFSLPKRVVEKQKQHPFRGLYVECRPIYDIANSMIGLGGIELFS
jgi:hypothetical protein